MINYDEESIRRFNLIKQLKERFLPLFNNFDHSKGFDEQVNIEPISLNKEDLPLLDELFNVLYSDAITYQVEHLKSATPDHAAKTNH